MVIKPRSTTIANRTKGNFHLAIEQHNRVAEDHRPSRAERVAFRGSMNSYLGLLAHYDTYRLRRLMLEGLSPWWLKAARVDAGLRKVVLKA